MNTVMLVVIALLLWFIVRHLERIATALVGLYLLAKQRQK